MNQTASHPHAGKWCQVQRFLPTLAKAARGPNHPGRGEPMNDPSLRNAKSSAKTAAAPLVRLSGISKRYGEVSAVKHLDLEINRGDFLAILGPSGCGKTTLLRIIGGFVGPTTGTVEIDGQDVTGLGPEKRPTNTVFQGYG